MMELRRVEDVLRDTVDELLAVDAYDTGAALGAAWRGFGVANAAGQLLAETDPGFAGLGTYAQPAFARVGETLRAAPSLPANVKPVMLNVALPTGDRFEQRRAAVIRDGILDVALALNTLLLAAALHARDKADHAACEEGACLADGLMTLF